MKIVKSREESCLLIKGVSEINKNKAKEQKGEFLPMILGSLTTSFLRKYVSKQRSNQSCWRCYSIWWRSELLMPPHPLSNFEIQKYYQNEFNDIYWRNNLPKKENGAYVINIDEYISIGTNCTAFYENGDNI